MSNRSTPHPAPNAPDPSTCLAFAHEVQAAQRPFDPDTETRGLSTAQRLAIHLSREPGLEESDAPDADAPDADQTEGGAK